MPGHPNIGVFARPALTLVPVIDNASVSEFTAIDCSTGWEVQVLRELSNENDTDYHVDIYVSDEQTPSTYSLLASEQTTTGSLYNDSTGVLGDSNFSDSTAYRTYRLDLIRKSDLAVVDTATTNTISTTYGACL